MTEDAPKQEQQQPQGPRFPIIILAAPGAVALLFVAMADKAADVLKSANQALLVAAIATLIAILCFGVIAAKSQEEQPVRIFGVIGVAAAVLLMGRAIMYMM
jgi:multisubunit Na+/H+ antiporter MnhB subunit